MFLLSVCVKVNWMLSISNKIIQFWPESRPRQKGKIQNVKYLIVAWQACLVRLACQACLVTLACKTCVAWVDCQDCLVSVEWQACLSFDIGRRRRNLRIQNLVVLEGKGQGMKLHPGFQKVKGETIQCQTMTIWIGGWCPHLVNFHQEFRNREALVKAIILATH